MVKPPKRAFLMLLLLSYGNQLECHNPNVHLKAHDLNYILSDPIKI